MKREFTFFRNPFLIITKNSYELAAEISTDVDASLGGIDGVPAVYTAYHALHEALMDAYVSWISQGGNQKGSTATLTDLFKGLRPSVAQWDYDIQGVYSKGSPEYIRLFPKGRAPFNTGKQITRIAAVGQLRENIGNDPLLVDVKTQVDGYYTSLVTTNTTQKNQKSQTDAKSQALEAARVAACGGLYSALASLMVLFKDDPTIISRYFPMDLLRKTQQTDFIGQIAINRIRNVAKRKLAETDIILLKNTGLVAYMAYLAETRGGALSPGVKGVTVPAGASIEVKAIELGNIAYSFLTLQNLSDTIKGAFEIAY